MPASSAVTADSMDQDSHEFDALARASRAKTAETILNYHSSLEGGLQDPGFDTPRLRMRDAVLAPQHKDDHRNGQDRSDCDGVIPSTAMWPGEP